MPFIYSEIHKNILGVFNEVGVEILSPAFMVARDGSLTTAPSQLKETDRGPLYKIVDYFMGINQKIMISKLESLS